VIERFRRFTVKIDRISIFPAKIGAVFSVRTIRNCQLMGEERQASDKGQIAKSKQAIMLTMHARRFHSPGRRISQLWSTSKESFKSPIRRKVTQRYISLGPSNR
jgi:hypothetical protein